MHSFAGVPEHFNFPFHLALESGAINIGWTDYLGGTGAMCQALRNAEADVAILLTEGIIADQARGNSAVVVGTYVQSPLIWGIHTGVGQSIQTISDLKGKPFAISRKGSGSQLMVFELARQQGWSNADFSFIEVGTLAGAREALTNNEAAGFMWERFMTQPEVDAGIMRRVGEIPTPWPAFSIAMRPEIWAERRQEVTKVLNHVLATAKTMKQDPLAPEKIAVRYGLQIDQVKQWLSLTEWAPMLAVDEPMLEGVRKRLVELGIIA